MECTHGGAVVAYFVRPRANARTAGRRAQAVCNHLSGGARVRTRGRPAVANDRPRHVGGFRRATRTSALWALARCSIEKAFRVLSISMLDCASGAIACVLNY